jgi:hypothetical protein
MANKKKARRVGETSARARRGAMTTPAGRGTEPKTTANARSSRGKTTASPRAAKGTRGRTAPAKPARAKAVPGGRRRRRTAGPATAAARGAATGGPRRQRGKVGPEELPPTAGLGLSEEDEIRAAKYLPRELPKRLFEEERFLFPESYGINRVRLLVRDPDWIFAYWDVSAEAMKDLRRTIGERALALSRLTLRVLDPVSGGSSDILLPAGARWWYVRTDSARRSYRAELGVTLPSGEFRRLAESNTVVTPRVGPSAERARRRLSYKDAREISAEAAAEAARAERQTGAAREPWAAGSVDGAAEPADRAGGPRRGGASDVFAPGGASDVFRPGAGDASRR